MDVAGTGVTGVEASVTPEFSTPWPQLPLVEVDEPPMPRRVRRTTDVVKLFASVVVLAIVVLAAAGASRTLTGIDRDLLAVGRWVPDPIIGVVSVVTALAQLILIPVLVAERLWARRYWSAALVSVAAPLAVALTAAVAVWLRSGASPTIADDFVPLRVGADDAALSGFIAGVVAASIAGGITRRTRIFTIVTIWLAIAAGLVSGTTTLLAAITVLALGSFVGFGVRVAAGLPTVRLDGRAVAHVLAAFGHPVRSLRGVPNRRPRRYVATGADGRALDVVVLERDQVIAGVLTSAWRTIRTRGEVLPHEQLSLEAAVARRSALSLTALDAGVRTPRLCAALPGGPDAALVVYEREPTRRLVDVDASTVDDATAADVWQQVRRLHLAGMAHRSLSPSSLRVDNDGRAWVYEAYGGEVAASSFARQVDVAHTLAALGTVIGPERAVASARELIAPAAIAAAVPLLQPIVLPRATRLALADKPDVLAGLRREITSVVDVPVATPLPVERFKPRTLLTIIGVSVALYLVGTELVDVDFAAVFSGSDWRWIIVAVLAVAATYVGTAAALLGFVSERVPYFRAIGAQLALSFVKLFAPAAVGNAAVNLRLLTRAGVSEGAAAASIAAGQLAAFVVTLPLLLLLSVLTGQAVASGLAPSPAALGVVGVVAAALALLLLVRPIRDRLRRLWNSVVEQGLPQLFEALQTPRKLIQGVGGNLLLTVGYSLCLYACVRAVGADVNIAAAAIVFLTGNTVGTAVPTPGGLGAVEAALIAGLGAAGVPGSLAVPAVLLYRLLSFWLPLAPGYVAWNRMQAKGYL